MPTMTKEERLAEIRQRIDDLEARAGDGTAETRARLQRRFNALRGDADAASAALDEKARRAEQAVVRESEQATQSQVQVAVSLGATILGALLGRKAVSTSTVGRATTTVRGAGRAMKERQDIDRAHRVSDRLNAGTVWINTYGPTDTRLPWGGMGGESGIGRDLGRVPRAGQVQPRRLRDLC